MSEVSLVDGHIDNGMTDKDIIKALECCTTHKPFRCNNCPYLSDSFSCRGTDLKKDALNLINRQKAEIENLNIELKAMRGAANSYKTEVERLQLESTKNTYFVSSRGSGKIYQTMSKMINLHDMIIKGFAEKLKEKAILYNLYNNEDYCKMVDVEDIDNLVKEMTESK